MPPFSNDWGEARYRTASEVPVLGGEDSCAVDYTLGCQPQYVAQRKTEIPDINSSTPGPLSTLCSVVGPAPQAAHSPSQHGTNPCSRGLAKTYNRMILSAHFH